MMKGRMDFMMNTFRGRVSNDLDELVHQTDLPFTTLVTSFPLRPKFCMPQIEAYDGSKDPLDHLEPFNWVEIQQLATAIIGSSKKKKKRKKKKKEKRKKS